MRISSARQLGFTLRRDKSDAILGNSYVLARPDVGAAIWSVRRHQETDFRGPQVHGRTIMVERGRRHVVQAATIGQPLAQYIVRP